jgi:DNA invertase Pin-like site-specific DNA recombinase
VDNPHATKLTIHILAAVAEHEREMIGSRTKAALQAAKARGAQLGRNAHALAQEYREAAISRATDLSEIFSQLSALGYSASAIARDLNRRDVPTAKGRKWHAATVRRVQERLVLLQATARQKVISSRGV